MCTFTFFYYKHTSVNPCIKCMECSVTQFGVSEFCETLTGGFTRKTPRRSNSQKSENLEEWNTQSGGIASGVELPVDSLLPFIRSRNQWEPEPVEAFEKMPFTTKAKRCIEVLKPIWKLCLLTQKGAKRCIEVFNAICCKGSSADFSNTYVCLS